MNIRMHVPLRPEHAEEAMQAVAHLASGVVTFSEEWKLPVPNDVAKPEVDEHRAREIAEAIAPKPKQAKRRMALNELAKGYDSITSSPSDAPDYEMRSALGAISKDLRPFSPYGSPIQVICEHGTSTMGDGRYLSTWYRPNALGRRVFEILGEMGVI